MYTVLLVLLLLDAILLAAAVLLQAGQGGGLASLGGGSGTEVFMGGRQAVTLLTKVTWWCAGIFLFLALTLAIMSSQSGAPRSALQGTIVGEPRYMPTIVADKTSSLTVLSSVLAGLFERERSGLGQAIEVPMMESVAAYVMVEHLYGPCMPRSCSPPICPATRRSSPTPRISASSL